MGEANLQVGSRVRHRTDGRVGVLADCVEMDGGLLCTVIFPDGEWDLDASLLESVSQPDGAATSVTFSPHRAWLRREAFRLADAFRNDPSSALSNSRIEPKPHQVSVAMRTLAKSQARMILSDEVGLGKTIEAGLILKELRARGVLDRVLVISPAALVTQWQQELSRKFNEHFVYADSDWIRANQQQRGPDANPWSSGRNLICSLQFARGDRQSELIAAAPWDLVIVDEAHHARRHRDGANKGYELLELMRDRVPGMLLLTATPMQLDDYELYSMVELVEPGLFADYEDFHASRSEMAALNEHMSWLHLPAGPNDRSHELYEFLRACGAPHEIVVLRPDRPAERAALISWFERQHRLSEALVRNRKAEVGGFTQRVARRIPVQPSQAEQDLELAVHDYIRRMYRASPAQGLVLVTFRKILASSTDALANAFERRANRLLDRALEDQEALTDDIDVAASVDAVLTADSERVEAEVAELEVLAAQARNAPDSKLEGLDRALQQVFETNPDEKVLIFTQFIGTLEMIRERLAENHRVVTFHGGMSIHEKDQAAQAFKGDAQIMVSSEAGGEGRNFQFCHVLINYDLPWNPMKVEQRIGRLDRVGQENDVYIYNFELRGTLDAQILDVLENRIQIFTETVGALDPILGNVERQIEQIYLLDPEAAEEEFTRFELDLDTRLHQAREREERLRDFIMDSRSFRRDEVNHLLRIEPRASLDDLERFVRAALDPYPTAEVNEVGERLVEIVFPPALIQRARQEVDVRLKDRYVGTFDHRTAVIREDVDFFAFGHTMIEGLIEFFSQELDVPIVALPPADPDVSGVAFDYRVRFGGVRPRDWMLSHLITGGQTAPDPALSPSSEARRTLEASEITKADLESCREISRISAAAEIRMQFDEFGESNRRLLIAEEERLTKLFDFQVRHLQNRINQNEALIQQWELIGTERERRTIPARRGLIEADRRRIARVEEERVEALRQLRLKETPSQEMALVGTTMVDSSFAPPP